MGDTKALTDTSSTGGFHSDGGDGDMAIPRGAKPIAGWMTGWMGRLGARTQRRGSLGFNDGHGMNTPPAHMGSVEEVDSVDVGLEQGKETGRPLGKTRNESFTNFLTCTPGGDGDQFHFRQRFGRKDSESQELCSHAQDMGRNDVTTVTDLPGGPVQMLPTLTEVSAPSNRKQSATYAQDDPLRGLVSVDPENSWKEREEGKENGKEEEGGEASIFLIDLEESEVDGKTQIKPKSKKFSASSLLSGKFTQNWFFRKNDDEYDNLVMEEGEEEDSNRRSSKLSQDSNTSNEFNEDEVGRTTLIKKLKNLTDKSSWREVNFGAPQGT